MIAAVAATGALHFVDTLEERLLGKKPVYDQERLAKRLFGSKAPAPFMRWGYGVAVGLLQERLRPNPLWYGPAIALAELVAMPLTGATPRVRKWPRGQVALLFAHATAFALLVQAATKWKSARRTAAG